MTFTRARHNPLSLVILNERHFCASEGPRRGARTGVPIMPAFGVMGWRCLAFFARKYSRVRHASLSSSGKARPAETPERSRRDTRGICFSPSLIYAPTRNSEIRHHPQPLHGRNNDREHLPPSPPQQMPSLSIALPPRALALNIRIEPQILASRERLHRNHIPHITRLNVHHQRINLLRRISRLSLPIHAINRLNFVSARMHYLGRLELHPPQF